MSIGFANDFKNLERFIVLLRHLASSYQVFFRGLILCRVVSFINLRYQLMVFGLAEDSALKNAYSAKMPVAFVKCFSA